MMDGPRTIIGRRAPEFDLPCTRAPGSKRDRARLADCLDRWVILVFYPRDFSLICPTELIALSIRYDEFQKRGCDIIGISTDTIETHERWIATPRMQGGLGGLRFPLASDVDGAVSRAYGVYLEQQQIALRGLFIIDPNGVLLYQCVHNLSVGRRSDEILRVLAALETGGMCAEDWCIDCETVDPTQTLVPGSILSHYRIENELGQGSFASVYRAHDITLDRPVALKVFKPGSLASPLDILAEARAAAALNHPNLCTIFGVDDSEGVPLIALEFIEGKPLSKVLKNGPLAPNRAGHVARQIALGMAAAHGHGIVHGDLKPANIMLTPDDSAKITDFGLSRRTSVSVDGDATQEWDLVDDPKISGTPGYMSPEQSRGEPVTPASDVFSLGVTIYEMLTGRCAFTGTNVLQVLSRIRQVDAGRLSADVPEPFSSILRGSLIRDPKARNLSMTKIADLLSPTGR